MAEPQYQGQRVRGLLIGMDPSAISRMDELDPPGVWANVSVDARDAGGGAPEPIGRESAAGRVTFLPRSTVEALSASLGALKGTVRVGPNGVPLEVSDSWPGARPVDVYGVRADIVSSADGGWALHPNAGQDLAASSLPFTAELFAEQWKEARWAAAPELRDAEQGLTSGEIGRLDFALEREAEQWEGVLEDVTHPEAESARRTIIAERGADDALFAQQAALLAFAETTADFDRAQLVEQAEHSDGWEGLSAAQFLAVASMHRYMREEEGPVQERSPEQEPGTARKGWNLRVPGLDRIKAGASQAVRYCRDSAFREEVNASFGTAAMGAAQGAKGLLERAGERVAAEAGGLRDRLKQRMDQARESVTATMAATKRRAQQIADQALAAVSEKAADGIETAVSAPDKLRSFAEGLRNRSAVPEGPGAEAAAAEPHPAHGSAEAAPAPRIIPHLGGLMDGTVAQVVDQGREVQERDLVVAIDRGADARLRDVTVQLNQESEQAAGREALGDPALILAGDVTTEDLRALRDSKVPVSAAEPLEGGGERFIVSMRAQLPLDARTGRPVLDSFSDIAGRGTPGPEIQGDVLHSQAAYTQLARDRDRQERERPVPERPAITSRDEDLIAASEATSSAGAFERS